MSLLPFSKAHGQQTICVDQNHFSTTGDMVLILGFDEEFEDRAQTDGNTSYDLRVGSIYRDHRDGVPRAIGDEETISILPGMTIIIQTLESFHFPSAVGGLILSKVSLLQRGLSNPATKVDPGYRGNLLITIVNHGQKTVFLKRGSRFCSLQLIKIEKPNLIYNKEGKSIGGTEKRTFLRGILDQVGANNPIVTAVNSAVTAILVIFTAIQLFR